MKPVIGIPLRYEYMNDKRPILYLSERLRRTLQKAGADIYMLVPVQDINYMDTSSKDFPNLTLKEKEQIDANISKCDGILFPGGYKFTPYDRYLLEEAIKKEIPILGICLGMQMMSCYKIDNFKLEDVNTKINHKQENDLELTHKVKIAKDSLLYKIVEKEELIVNSFHKKRACNNKYYKTVAKSEDGVIEAIEYPSKVFNLGVQWHPEISYEFDEDSKKIIDYFIKEAKKQNKC